ncbi:hypothetical protein C8F04DRAFT_1132707 [Mycena alexandri]|uniref:Secreted protein n=1 Tax=Mycena alexandri TaxID=1745969 RepID=A0AAD6SAI4_9AGAR|nr:hypothetical protein C8F04DRAFT_1132707 [Mycena alexandri]
MHRAPFFYSIKLCLELVALISMSNYIQSKPSCRCVLTNSNMMRLNEASPFTYLLATRSFPIFSLIRFVQLATNASLFSFNSQKSLQTNIQSNSSRSG